MAFYQGTQETIDLGSDDDDVEPPGKPAKPKTEEPLIRGKVMSKGAMEELKTSLKAERKHSKTPEPSKLELPEEDKEAEGLEPVIEVNESISEVLEIPPEVGVFEETSPRIFNQKDISENYMTLEPLNNVIYELGIVDLCWPTLEPPEELDPVFETRTCFPESYYKNNAKERILLAYTENFRRQFHFHFKHINRKPLLLQAPNDCGLQKMVCTTIRSTKICYTGTNTWQGLTSLVADFFVYEPLTKPMLHPERILSPFTCLKRRAANPFEMATVLVSWLLGAGYDAYVVVGTAKRDLCLNIRYRSMCPNLPDESEVVVEEEKEPEEKPRYQLVPLPDFTSKYMLMMDQRVKDKIQKEIDRKAAERAARIAELELPPPDDIDDWRTHAWVLVLPGFVGVEEPFFIEPSQGNAYSLDYDGYEQIDSVYSNENYYVNLQRIVDEFDEEGELLPRKHLDSLNYDLADLTCWEHLIVGEPFHRRSLIGVDNTDPRTCADTEKHLDIPASWVEKLDISSDEFEQRYPGNHKVTHYKKVLLEHFSRYSERTGITKRIIIFEDYALTTPLVTYEYYSNREDFMFYARIDHVKNEITEEFLTGRPDHIIKHTYSIAAPPQSIEGDRVLEFKYFSRLDHLAKVACSPLSFSEYFTDREDRLLSREIIYTEGTKAEPKRNLKDITETYKRNPDVPAKDDVWKRIFHMQDNSIELQYHYAYNFVTNYNRFYMKPNLAETGGKILFYPDKTHGYIADPCGEEPRPLNVYYGLCDNMHWENRTTKHVREYEADMTNSLQQRYKEITEPSLYVSLFDTYRNETAIQGWLEQERLKAMRSEREMEAEIDPLAPYLARMFGSGTGPTCGATLTMKEAQLLYEQCMNDFKAKQLARQLAVQERFDRMNGEYKAKRLWYLANQFILTPEKESAYFALSAELAFAVSTLEVRLSRHKELSGPRFKALEEMLEKHPLLKEYNRMRAYYGRGK